MTNGSADVAWITWHDDSEVFNRRPELVGAAEEWEPPHYSVYLDIEGENAAGGLGPPDPSFVSLDDALAYAKTRATRIIVRPSWSPTEHFVASDDPPHEWVRLDP